MTGPQILTIAGACITLGAGIWLLSTELWRLYIERLNRPKK